MKKTNKVSMAKVGLGVVAVTAAAAVAAYFLASPKNKKKMQVWAMTAKKEIHDAIVKIPSLTKTAYTEVVSAVGKKYAAVKDIDQKEVAQLVKDAKAQWVKISANIKKAQAKAKASMLKEKLAAKKAAAKKGSKK